MRAIKLIGAGVFALFTLGSLISFIGNLLQTLGAMNSASSNSDGFSFAIGQLAGGIIITLLFGAIALKLWKSAKKPPQNNDTVSSPLPEVPRREH